MGDFFTFTGILIGLALFFGAVQFACDWIADELDRRNGEEP